MKDLKEKLINLIILVNKAYQLGTDKVGIRTVGYHSGRILGFYLSIKTEGEPIEREISFYSESTLISSDEKVKILKVESEFSRSFVYSNSYHQCPSDFFYKDRRVCQNISEEKGYYYLYEMNYLHIMEEAAKKYNSRGWLLPASKKETFEIIEVNKSKLQLTYKINFGRLKTELTVEDFEKINAALSETNNSTELELLEKITELLK